MYGAVCQVLRQARILRTSRETTRESLSKEMAGIWNQLVPIDSLSCGVCAKENHAILEPKTAMRQGDALKSVDLRGRSRADLQINPDI